MKLTTLLICLTIVLNLSNQSLSQQKSSSDSTKKQFLRIVEPVHFKNVIIQEKKLDSNYNATVNDAVNRKVDWDLIGTGLLKGLEYKRLYQNEVLLTKVLKYEISLWEEKSTNKDLVISRLATELSKQPAFISTHDWKITILISGLTAILTAIVTLQLTK